MKRIFFLTLLSNLILPAHPPLPADAPSKVTVDPERKAPELIIIPRKDINHQGWLLRVDKRLLPEGELYDTIGKRSLSLIKSHLGRIDEVIPKAALAELKKVPIILDEHPQMIPAQYHPSIDWLEKHNYDPALGHCVQICRASFFISPERTQWQQAVVLHELAHAYHHQVLGFENEEILQTFANGRDTGIYDKVLHANGKETRHYALTDHKEYFAEATEAFYAANDFFPFVRAELHQHDPKAYEMIRRAWERKTDNLEPP